LIGLIALAVGFIAWRFRKLNIGDITARDGYHRD
jgi:hypothetical protein